MATSRASGAEDFSNFSYSRTRPEAEIERDKARHKAAVRVVASSARDVADARHLLSVLGLSDSVGEPSCAPATKVARVSANVI